MNNPEFHKGYAKYAKIADEDRKSWYIPYAFVFDCSGQFGCISINNELMSGPDLTNQLVEVLIRFRQDYIAFLWQINSMDICSIFSGAMVIISLH